MLVNLGIDARIRTTAVIVEVNNLFERWYAAVVHVRRGACDLAKRGRFERSVTADTTRRLGSARIVW